MKMSYEEVRELFHEYDEDFDGLAQTIRSNASASNKSKRP